MRTRLGSFELVSVLGRGGMATVWEARHLEQDVGVALKVMTERLARRPRHREAFFEEVRAVARLRHPGIVMVLDVGEIDAQAADQLRLPTGCPYLAMELVTPGALPRAGLQRDWPTCYRIATALLDALAHAHARGVIHRDIKGDNILVAEGEPPGDWTLKLSDFGLARSFSDVAPTDPDGRTSGTPRYMAPEQIVGDVRRQGPWTDLYAVGCVIWWLVCGAPPFTSRDQQEVLRAHVSVRPPPLRPKFDVPADLEAWLRRLLAKRPADRFRRAADAAWALHRLADFSGGVWQGDGDGLRPDTADTVVDDTVPAVPPRPKTLTLADVTSADDLELGPSGVTPTDRPPIPQSWRRPVPPPPPPRLLGAGLGLYGLRTVPMVDREPERDALWSELRRVAASGEPRLVTLRGGAGTGKSRVAEWICERAHEVGGAQVFRAVHSRNGGPLDGVGPMLARQLRIAGLEFASAFERVVEELRSHAVEWQPSFYYDARVVAGSAGADVEARDVEAGERDVAYANFLRVVASERPIVFLVDDAQWADEALRLVDVLLRRRDAAVLIVLTVRSGEQAPLLGRHLERWGGRDVPVDPLKPGDHRVLVRQLLGLDEELARSVASRTAGNPLFAAQLVGDWVERGVLVVGERGFELSEGAEARLPDSVLDVALERVKSALRRTRLDPDHAMRAAEVAAILGRTVDTNEWLAALRNARIDTDHQLIETCLATAGLIRLDVAGFAFVHATVAETLVERARTAGDWAGLNRACAEALDELSSEASAPRMSQRRARHRERAGDVSEAVDAWAEHANELASLGQYDEARDVLTHRDELLDRLDVGEDDRRRVEAALLRGIIAGDTGDSEAALEWISEVERVARAGGWQDLLARASRGRSIHALMTGRLADAEQFARNACRAYEQTGDQTALGRAEYDLGLSVQYLGRTREAAECFESARRRFAAAGNDNYLALAHTGLGEVALMDEQLDLAATHLREAARIAKGLGSRHRQAAVALQLGDVERRNGDLGEARACYEQAESLWRSIGNPNADVAALKLIWVRFDEGDFDATDQLDSLIGSFEANGRWYAVRYARLGVATCAAHSGDVQRFDDAFDTAVAEIEASADVHIELAILAGRVAKACRERGWNGRAERAEHLASDLRASRAAD